jgi:hypothetical protein
MGSWSYSAAYCVVHVTVWTGFCCQRIRLLCTARFLLALTFGCCCPLLTPPPCVCSPTSTSQAGACSGTNVRCLFWGVYCISACLRPALPLLGNYHRVFPSCFCWTQLVSMHVETAVVKVTSAVDCNEAISAFDMNKAKAEYVCLPVSTRRSLTVEVTPPLHLLHRLSFPGAHTPWSI